MRVLVGLSGKAGCGKSTIAKHLEKNYGFVRLSFAAPLKRILKELFPEKMSGDKEVYRNLMQKFGTEWCRSVDSECWVNHLLRRVANNSDKNVVVDDMRFLNEYVALRKHGFIVVRVLRHKELLRKWGYNVDDSHPSEVELDNVTEWDVLLPNNGDYPFVDASEQLMTFLLLRHKLWNWSPQSANQSE